MPRRRRRASGASPTRRRGAKGSGRSPDSERLRGRRGRRRELRGASVPGRDADYQEALERAESGHGRRSREIREGNGSGSGGGGAAAAPRPGRRGDPPRPPLGRGGGRNGSARSFPASSAVRAPARGAPVLAAEELSGSALARAPAAPDPFSLSTSKSFGVSKYGKREGGQKVSRKTRVR